MHCAQDILTSAWELKVTSSSRQCQHTGSHSTLYQVAQRMALACMHFLQQFGWLREKVGPRAQLYWIAFFQTRRIRRQYHEVCQGYHVVTHVIPPLYSFCWERFKILCSKPTQHDALEIVEAEEDGKVAERPDRPYQPRAKRWLGVKQNKHKKLYGFLSDCMPYV